MAKTNVTNLSLAALQALAAAQLDRLPIAQISLWPNNKRRADKNDAQFTGRQSISNVRYLEGLRAKLSTEAQAKLDDIIAELTATGALQTEVYFDVWQNQPSVGKSGGDRPILSGRARNFVGEQASAGGDAQSDSIVAALSAAAGK